MTNTRIETVYTFDGWTEELERRIKVQTRRTLKKIQRKIIRFLKWAISAVLVIGFFAIMFLYWLKFGYIL